MYKLTENSNKNLKIKILGVGTAGCKVLDALEINGMDKVYVNRKSMYSKKSTKQFSTNLYLENDDEHDIAGNPSKGYQLAKNNHELIQNIIKNNDIIYVISCLGGSGGGITQYIIEQLQEECNILSIGMLSLPFDFEGDRKNNIAKANYNRLCGLFDSAILVENDKHLKLLSTNNTSDIFIESNNLFAKLIISMTSITSSDGLINVDMDDLLIVMKNMGPCTLAIGRSEGGANDERAIKAVESMINSVLLDYDGLSSAKGFLINITGGTDITVGEFEQIVNGITATINDNVRVIVGAAINPEYLNDIEVTVIASGLPELSIKPDIEEYDFSEIYRTIEFSKENVGAGLSILSYFEQVLKQKYNNLIATVKIEQNNNSVKLLINTKEGDVEVIEKALTDYGHVVKGDLRTNEFLSNPLDIERLNMKLEMASLELRQNQRIISLYESENGSYKTRVENLESQVEMLNHVLCEGLIISQKTLQSNLNQSSEVITSIMMLVDEMAKNGLTEKNKSILKDKIELAHKQDFTITSEIDSLIKNTIYGVTGNAVFNYLQSILLMLPK